MNNLLDPQRSRNWRDLPQLGLAALLILLVAPACSQRAPSGIEDVEDIPSPSLDIADDDDDDSSSTTDDDDDSSSATDDDDSTTDDDDDDDTPVEPTTPVTYTLTGDDSLLYVQVFKDPNTLFAGLAHDHVMRATNWTGTFEYDPADLSSCSLQISIDVDDMLVDEDGMREYVGYGDTINANDRATIQQNMLASGQLNAASFSQISIAAQTCGLGSGAGPTDGNLEVTFDMTLRGTTRTKTAVLDLTIQDGAAYMQGTYGLTATEFGFSPYQFMGGGVRNLDDMTISFDMVGFEND